jgi:hypothetical protein
MLRVRSMVASQEPDMPTGLFKKGNEQGAASAAGDKI